MEKRFERRAEAGGEQGHDKSDKRSWLERLSDRLKTDRHEDKSQSETSQPQERQSFSEFIRGIFNKDDDQKTTEPKSENWVDRAVDDNKTEQTLTDHEKIEAMDEQERTEFLMVVSERFKGAGERLLRFITRHERPNQPEVGEAESMYQDDYEDDLSEVPELELPQSEAPPFDFAVSSMAEARLVESPSEVTEAPIRPFELGQVDDFDYDNGRNAGASATVSTDGDTRTISYRPRMRDVLFASAVGSSEGRREMKSIERRLQKKQKRALEKNMRQVKREVAKVSESKDKFEQERRKLTEAIDKLAAEHSDRSTTSVETANQKAPNQPNQTVETVRNVIEQVFQQPEPEDRPAHSAEYISRQAAAEAGGVDELEFRNLKPKSTSVEESTPDGVFVKSIPNPKPTDRPSQQVTPDTIENPFKEKLRQHSVGETAPQQETQRTRKPQPSLYEGAVSLNEIISDRSAIPESPRSLKERVKSNYDISTDLGATNWVATSVILGLVLIALIFISAT